MLKTIPDLNVLIMSNFEIDKYNPANNAPSKMEKLELKKAKTIFKKENPNHKFTKFIKA